MPLLSMTGFGRADGSLDGTAWVWEVRSVNGRGLDVRSRLPPGFEALDQRLRETIARRLSRGNVSANLQVQRQQGSVEYRLNEAALDQVLKAAEAVRARVGGAHPTVEGLLGIRGVLETAEPFAEEAEAAARNDAVMVSLERALDALLAARAAEGERLAATLLAQLAEIERLVAVVRDHPARSPEAIATRLGDQVRRLLDAATAPLDADRLHQEAALLATRADVEEEVQRLGMHVAAARELIAETGPAGRKLDFLTQEFNREANTLCSKANAIEITRAGLALKAIIDQMREQVQNVE